MLDGDCQRRLLVGGSPELSLENIYAWKKAEKEKQSNDNVTIQAENK